MKEVGVCSSICQQPAVTATSRPAVITRWRSAALTSLRNLSVKDASPRSKAWKNLFLRSSGFLSLRRIAQSAGVSVRATKPESTTDRVTVTANWR